MRQTWSQDELVLLSKNLNTPIEDVVTLFPDRSFNSVHVKWKRMRQKQNGSLDVEGDVQKLIKKEEKKDIENIYRFRYSSMAISPETYSTPFSILSMILS